VAQPADDLTKPRMHWPEAVYTKIMSTPDDVLWAKMSETTPPVAVD
jgi:hypothetical protein